jgi:arylsulfatase A-like enzyme
MTRSLYSFVITLIALPAFNVSGTADDQIISPSKINMETKRTLLGQIKRPPNVVLFFADDLGYADTGVYGSKTIPTPHIDALAKRGVRFTDAYVTAGTCSPSRAGLISGRYQQRFGFEFNTAGAAITHHQSRGLDPTVITFPKVLQVNGYTTGMFGKWHLGTRSHFHPNMRGFDEFFGFLAGAHGYFPVKREERTYSTVMRNKTHLKEPDYLTDAFARETVRFIQKNRDKRFFAYVPFNAVHTPIEASKKYLDRFPDVRNRQQKTYNAMVRALDDAVGAIVAALKETQTEKNTLLIFMNDNGGPIYTSVQSNAPLRLGKLFLFEGGIRVPMIMSWPDVLEAGSVYRQPVSSLDIYPTLCAAAGVVLPSGLKLDGVNLFPHLNGEIDTAPHEALFWSNGPNRAVRFGKWKMVQAHDQVWLFDLKNDIGETKNLALTKPDILKTLQAQLKQWQGQMKSPAWPSKPNRRKVMVDGFPYELNI